MVESLKRQEDEIGTRDKQIMSLYQRWLLDIEKRTHENRIEGLQKENDDQGVKFKAAKVKLISNQEVNLMKEAENEELMKS